MMRILHLCDSSATWEQRSAIAQLRQHLPQADHVQRVATIDRVAQRHLRFEDAPVTLLRRRLKLPALAGAAVHAFAERESIDVIHAWGVDAAAAARAAWPSGNPVAVTVFDPGVTKREARILRTIGTTGRLAIVCAAQRVRRRLVECGIPFKQCVVLRPAVDFSCPRTVDGIALRAELGLPPQGTIVLVPELSREHEDHYAAIWSVLMRGYLEKNVRLIVPGVSRRLPKLRRLARSSENPQAILFTEDRYAFEQLCALADYLVLGSTGEVSLTAIAWAMACETSIIAPATHATTELLEDNRNALLFNAPSSWRRRATRICALYSEGEQLTRIKETARGQAYNLFSLRRATDQHRRLYENLVNGAAPEEGITDPAAPALPGTVPDPRHPPTAPDQ